MSSNLPFRSNASPSLGMNRDNDEDLVENEAEGEDEDDNETTYKTVKDAILFAIDVSTTMLKKPDPSDSKTRDTDSPTFAALRCAYHLMQQRIISNPKDMMGILLFGTKESKCLDGESTLSYPHCYLVCDLGVPTASDVKRLRNLIEDEKIAAGLLQPATISNADPGVLMSHVLFCANQIFTTRAPNFSSRRLFLVTDNDNPHPDDKVTRRAATVRAKDLYDLGVVIELFPISRPDHGSGFDRAHFYDDIVYRPASVDPEAPAPSISATSESSASAKDGITLLQSLLSAINSKATPRRALFSLPLELGHSLKISVKGYILIKRQERVRSSYIWLEGEKPQIAIGTTARLSDDNERTVEPADVRKAYKFGGDAVTFTPEEAKKIRQGGGAFGDPVIRIIGFKDLTLLPMWANTRPAYFLYPSEDGFIGSTRVFAALRTSLRRKNKFALAWFMARRNATPVLVALVPGIESMSSAIQEQPYPPGLWAISLPFADDLRQLPDLGSAGLILAPDELVDKMRVILQQLQLPNAVFSPQRYPNPSLQWFYKILQALALDEDIPTEPEDKTMPRHRQIHKRAGEYILEWGSELDEQFRNWQQQHSQMLKRSTTTLIDDKIPKSKRAKTRHDNEQNDAIEDEVMRSSWERNSVSKFKVDELKLWLASKKLPTNGKKAELVGSVESWFEQKR